MTHGTSADLGDNIKNDKKRIGKNRNKTKPLNTIDMQLFTFVNIVDININFY